jgi:hypothetical protein
MSGGRLALVGVVVAALALGAANAPGIRDRAALRGPGWQFIESDDPPAGLAAELAAARACQGASCP